MPILFPRIHMKMSTNVCAVKVKRIHHSSCSPCDWDQIGNKTCYILKVRKRISTLTDLKVSSLACNPVFYKPENAKVTT